MSSSSQNHANGSTVAGASASRPVLLGFPDRPWHLRVWSGMTFGSWMRVLARNRFAISPTCIPMAAILTGISLVNSCLALLQHLVYGRRIESTRLVEDPLFVLGHWRSGTTLLHELLACDPRNGYPSTYACFAPNHFLLTERVLKPALRWLVPPQRPMDNMPFGWENPQEDEWALCNMGLPSPYLQILFPNRPLAGPSYLDLRDVPAAERERWAGKLLWFFQSLTLRQPKRLVLKAPAHTARIRTLLGLFPHARFVHIVRDPFQVFPSTLHTWKRMYRHQGLQVPRYRGLEEYVLATFVRMYEVFEEDVRSVGPGRIWELRYEDLIADPVGQVQAIYEHLDLGDFAPVRPRIEEYVARNQAYQRNRYAISEADRRRVAERWAAYAARYGYDGGAAEDG